MEDLEKIEVDCPVCQSGEVFIVDIIAGGIAPFPTFLR
jgi:hypothetical protein